MISTVKLNDGTSMPIIAFGTGTSHMLAPQNVTEAVKEALSAGFRAFDTSTMYHTNSFAGPAFKEWFESGKGKRSDLFITGKGGEGNEPPEAFDMIKWCDESIQQLQCEYLDLFLIQAATMVSDIPKAWKQMEELVNSGKVKSIGLSAFRAKDLDIVLSMCNIKPAVLQIEYHPHALSAYDPRLHQLCVEHDIRVQAVSAVNPLKFPELNQEASAKVAKDVAEQRGLREDAGEVLMLWAKQMSAGQVVTTTSNPERMTKVMKLFDDDHKPLSGEDLMKLLKAGKSKPFRMWGYMWYYVMNGEGVDMQDPAMTYWTHKPDYLEAWDAATLPK